MLKITEQGSPNTTVATVAIAHTREKHRSPERVLALMSDALAHIGGGGGPGRVEVM